MYRNPCSSSILQKGYRVQGYKGKGVPRSSENGFDKNEVFLRKQWI